MTSAPRSRHFPKGSLQKKIWKIPHSGGGIKPKVFHTKKKKIAKFCFRPFRVILDTLVSWWKRRVPLFFARIFHRRRILKEHSKRNHREREQSDFVIPSERKTLRLFFENFPHAMPVCRIKVLFPFPRFLTGPCYY